MKRLGPILAVLFFLLGVFAFTGRAVYCPLSEVPCEELYDGRVQVNQLMYLSRQLYGEVVWMEQGTPISVTYHSGNSLGKSPYERAQADNRHKEMILQTTAAYAGDFALSTQLGVAMEQGMLINKNLEPHMEGLVLVQEGGLQILGLHQPQYFAPLQRTLDLRNVYDRTRLLAWAEREKSGIWQTHLLAFGQALQITRAGRKKVADRKLLAVVTKDGKEQVALFHFARSVYLYDAAKMTLDYLQTMEGIQVQGIVNLDTGVHNVLELAQEVEDCEVSTLGKDDPEEAANLLTFSYKE